MKALNAIVGLVLLTPIAHAEVNNCEGEIHHIGSNKYASVDVQINYDQMTVQVFEAGGPEAIFKITESYNNGRAYQAGTQFIKAQRESGKLPVDNIRIEMPYTRYYNPGLKYADTFPTVLAYVDAQGKSYALGSILCQNLYKGPGSYSSK
ncbi:MAG: hypothetical protein AAGB31_11960 [Bdellovibrio sp.]